MRGLAKVSVGLVRRVYARTTGTRAGARIGAAVVVGAEVFGLVGYVCTRHFTVSSSSAYKGDSRPIAVDETDDKDTNRGEVDKSSSMFASQASTRKLAAWLDATIVTRKGRAFEANEQLMTAGDKDAVIFPPVKGYNLNLQETTAQSLLDDSCSRVVHTGPRAKIICFSTKDFGYNLLRTWIKPFMNKYPLNNSKGVTFLEICHVEFAFLSMAKGVFASNLRSKTSDEAHDRTMLVFGGLMDLADRLRIPNKYTGYIFLLDRDNRIRWRASGQMLEEKDEINTMYKCIEEVVKESESGTGGFNGDDTSNDGSGSSRGRGSRKVMSYAAAQKVINNPKGSRHSNGNGAIASPLSG